VAEREDDRTPIEQLVEQAADLFLYAPIGLFFEGPTLLPKLAEQGRVHARNARVFGQFAVRHGEAEVRRRVGDVEQQAGEVLRTFGLLPDRDETDRGAPPAPADDAIVDDLGARLSGNGHGPEPSGQVAGPGVDELAIPGYDSLSASQVVTRLEGLTPPELEAVRAYESANRGRKTILNKVAQLQS
jgi:hypothetical protein